MLKLLRAPHKSWPIEQALGSLYALMIVGISMLGVITASVAAWFVERTRREEDEILAEVRKQRNEIAELRDLVLALRQAPSSS